MKQLIAIATMLLIVGCTAPVKVEVAQEPAYPLTRGPVCLEEPDTPVNVNLVFEEIKLMQAVQLMADFSCNYFTTNMAKYGDKMISVDYQDFHWRDVLVDLCEKHDLHCWTEVEQAYALGRAAVEMALAGDNAVMPTVVRKSDSPYKWGIGQAKLEDVANVEKMMPNDFISEDGFGITEACRRYLSPLIEGEDYPPYENGLPKYVTLKNNPVEKILKTEFKI